eukprot:GCRY01002993.1.p1 GENE.GCRY01002993.1~~GCRY01002993.1.p1  ORF type:complete len:243 (-),score=34.20 GCRY01002993.1:267-995(-)
MRPQAVFLGDSLTQKGYEINNNGWMAVLSDIFTARLDIVNRGYSGYNTRFLRPVLYEVLPWLQTGKNVPAILTLLIGSNDASLQEHNSQQHVPLKEFEDNLLFILKTISEVCPRVVVITPPTLDPQKWLKFLQAIDRRNELDRTVAVTAQYADVVRTITSTLNLPLIDFHQALREQDAVESFFTDGLHLSRKGNKLLASLWLSAVEKNFPEIASVNTELPPWGEVDDISVLVEKSMTRAFRE